MSEIVFILGAGASRVAGAPLMNDFLDVAYDQQKSGMLKDIQGDVDLVFEALNAIKPVHARSRIQLRNLESAFDAFELGALLGRLGSLRSERVPDVPRAMRRVILRVLENTIAFPSEEGRVAAPQPYEQFLTLLSRLVTQKLEGDWERVSVITFNYDLCVDYAAFQLRQPVAYCLQGGGNTSGLRLLKLHGSLNWVTCGQCKAVVPWALSEYFRTRSWGHLSSRSASPRRLALSSDLRSIEHCGVKEEREPFIVPPTMNKARHHGQIDSVWRAAATELSTAESIYVIGYSLPATDHFFRYLYALGSLGDARLKRFRVYDPDKHVEERFRGMLGPESEERFSFEQSTFASAITELFEEYELVAEE